MFPLSPSIVMYEAKLNKKSRKKNGYKKLRDAIRTKKTIG
jgi:hypothetical protein